MGNNKLSQIIFKDVVYYLINNESSFSNILNIALISKSTFKNVQNIIVNQKIDNKDPIYFNLSEFLLYLINSMTNSNEYDKVLIQYKSIKVLYTKIKYFPMDGEYLDIKGPLCEFCPKLQSVVFLRAFYSYENPLPLDGPYFNEEEQPEDNKLFKYKKISILYDEETGLPCSSEQENNYSIGYSFSFLSCYDPLKLSISLTPNKKNKIINNFSGIFKNGGKSLGSIEFKKNHPTPYKFLEQSLKTNKQNIKSLKLRYNNISFINIKDEDNSDDEDEDEDEEDEDENEHEDEIEKEIVNSNDQYLKELASVYDYNKLIEFSVKISNLPQSNKTLEKLLFRKCLDDDDSNDGDNIKINNNNDKPSLLINQLVCNSTLKTLGLEFYDITTSLELSQLSQIPNITTLYCNINSVKYFFQHCFDNPNIKKLIVTNEEIINEVDPDVYKSFSDFFKSNTTLYTIIIKLNNNEISNNIKKLFFESNNQSHLNFLNK
ncbi:hypothetical protein DICPUDRAFT_82154 [Dictyostelium purpureum]|uniref:Uncharacterized protein n=1 Tax=Dictyostelium purpureum TaxID=5786 RepID=F0ZVP3_DICPU|nr:uncharacterized protein DICPUDRAFT_82154 [Dictyostelium purpureum]EGC31983.1 hypothetical protein DICPUDRAFT_82154 [Dictyostelium purpureum]|eukprot:XP_003291481.1 hypothetical protein DICPUDRAFT_82154 [Dictyostelium purpureum]